MKTKSILFAFLAWSFTMIAIAQEEVHNDQIEYKTLFKNKEKGIAHGGYAGITLGYTSIENSPAIHVGGRMAWVINHNFALGVAGKGFFNNLDKPYPVDNSNYMVAGGYGGIFLQPIIFAHHPVHVSFPIIIGAGGVTVNNWNKDQQYHWDYENYEDPNYYNYDYFFVVEPGVDVEFNLLRFLRLSVGASYRFANNVTLVYQYNDETTGLSQEKILDKNLMNNFSINLAIMFGWF